MRGVIAMALIVLLVCYLFLTMVGCSPAGARFHVNGHITEAEDSTLLLEAMTLTGVRSVDSVRLTSAGDFDFAIVPDTSSAPEFYRLRIGSQVINFVVDSLEDIRVEAPFARMATAYEIGGNDA